MVKLAFGWGGVESSNAAPPFFKHIIVYCFNWNKFRGVGSTLGGLPPYVLWHQLNGVHFIGALNVLFGDALSLEFSGWVYCMDGFFVIRCGGDGMWGVYEGAREVGQPHQLGGFKPRHPWHIYGSVLRVWVGSNRGGPCPRHLYMVMVT